jgi:hypothetical protein
VERIAAFLLGHIVGPPPELPRESIPPDVTFRRGYLVPKIGGILARMSGPAAAVTMRRTIVLGPGVELTPSLLAHELAHVRQWRNDRLFPLRYCIATLRHGYHGNPYEVEARAIAHSASVPQPGEEAS